MKMRQAGAAFWVWLAAILLGPFVPFLTAPLGSMIFEEPNHIYRGGDWRGVQAMTYLGLPMWALVIITASIWLGKRLPPEGTDDSSAARVVGLVITGLVISVVWGFVGCVVVPTVTSAI